MAVPAALVTIAIGAIGVLGARHLMTLIGFSVVGSMGTLLVAVSGVFNDRNVRCAVLHGAFNLCCGLLVPDCGFGDHAPRG